MSEVVQYASSAIKLTFKSLSFDPRDMKRVDVTISSRGQSVNFEKDRLVITLEDDKWRVRLPLRQEDTGNLRVGPAEVQVNFTDTLGQRLPSKILSFTITRNLLKRVVQ